VTDIALLVLVVYESLPYLLCGIQTAVYAWPFTWYC